MSRDECFKLMGFGLIAAAVLVGLLLAPRVAPYQFQAATSGGFWRFDRVTGEVVLCLAETDPYDLACTKPRRTEWRPPG